MLSGIKRDVGQNWALTAFSYLAPLIVASSVAALLMTSAKLPSSKMNWVNKFFAAIRSFGKEEAEAGRSIAKKNQFALGEADFNVISFWLIFLPYVISGFGYMPFSLDYATMDAIDNGLNVTRAKLVSASSLCGWAGAVTLSFFLIPVTRHSVLLASMGWSPVHALRIHIWAGHLSFLYVFIHTILLFFVFLAYDDIPVWRQFIPNASCFGRDANFAPHHADDDATPPLSPGEDCQWQYWNLTGIVAFIFFAVLWVSSIHYFRRRWYRLFYILHVVFGTLMLLASILHFGFIALYLAPSIAYYLASTFPTLIQALASRFRKGVKIVKVTTIADSGGCVEVHVATTADANALLDREPCQYVKLCVPKISIVWHPFTVYKHPKDSKTVRILFRPVGPFTKELASSLTAPERPITMLDGFYGGADRTSQALQHDQVTIVAGGVAITPFLSMIPNLLTTICTIAPEKRVVKSITLHWSCRDRGLERFVTQNYIRGMIATANKLDSSVSFHVMIYHTGKGGTEVLQESSSDNTSVEDFIEERRENESVSSDEAHDYEEGGMPFDVSPKCNLSDDEGENLKAGDATLDHTNDGTDGHMMELAHMLPGRFAEFRWNLPYFVAFSVGMWTVFCLLFRLYYGHWMLRLYYNDWNFNAYYLAAEATWVTMVIVAISFALSCAIEGMVFLSQSRWPSPTADRFMVEEVSTSKEHELTDASSVGQSVVKHIQGRPKPTDLFEQASQAEAPGIFICGPLGMTSVVWKEARKENSFFGRTRYCVYDEPFEF
jgi:predicted ferric reductase